MIGKVILTDNPKNRIAPGNVSNLKIKIGNNKVTIFWGDPEDTVVDGKVISAWKGTKVVYKVRFISKRHK